MRAHTVILGAGATMAAIPNGDKNGRKSSVMDGMITKLGLDNLLKEVKLETKSKNIEDIYSELSCKLEYSEIVNELEESLYQYFDEMELPDDPTIYDLLILSLTGKDVIATFNWDPLLLQAFVRCARITNNLPHILCLHGNVYMGYCQDHDEYGIKNAICPICKKQFPPVKLLYPVKEKNYKNDEYISKSWEAVDAFLNESYMVTIFGYSAPSSDVEAVELLKRAWGDKENRQLEEVSVIDIIDESEMIRKWDSFIYSHHYRYTNDFYNSYLGMFPRRSCETVFSTFSLNVTSDNTRGFRKDMTWDEVKEKLAPLLIEEMNTEEGHNLPLSYAKRSC